MSVILYPLRPQGTHIPHPSMVIFLGAQGPWDRRPGSLPLQRRSRIGTDSDLGVRSRTRKEPESLEGESSLTLPLAQCFLEPSWDRLIPWGQLGGLSLGMKIPVLMEALAHLALLRLLIGP